MKKTSSILFFFVLFLICTDVMAMEFIKTGPFGTPILVKDPYGNFSIPIKVYSDSEIEVFIPNITAPGWVFWNKDVFNQKGTYFTYIYDHFKNESYCLRQILPKGKHSDADRLAACSQLRYRCRLILVDVRQNNVTMREVILMGKDAIWHPANVSNPNLTYPLKDNSQLSKATLLSIAKITAIVEKEVREAGSTQSAQDVMRHNREMTSRMAAAGRPSSKKSITDINCEKDCYTECLKPGPKTVILTGKLERRIYPGPPNYEDIKKGDQPETGFYLLLKEPVCYVGDELSDPKQNVSLIQLVLDQKGYDELRPYLGKIIKLKGSLFGSHTGHHHTPILLENIVLSEPINSQEYVEYCNERYGFCVNYPSNFKKERPPDNGDGQRFNDGKGFLMIVSGINNGLDDNLKTEMASQSKDFDKITYQTYKNNWFVLSGYKGSNILYLKTYVGRSSINHLYIQFPSSQKNEYDNIVTKISKSFKSGNLNDFQ